MELTREQIDALGRGDAVPLTVAGQRCVLVRQDVYDRGQADHDAGPWTTEEMDRLASETADLLAGDGLDLPDEP